MATYVIPCGGEKCDGPRAARNLYIGSMFTHALRRVEECLQPGDRCLILSAKYGLIEPTQMIEPYDLKMGDEGSASAALIAVQAAALGIDFDGDSDIWALLPRDYFDVLDEALRLLDVYPMDCYEATIGVGEHRMVCNHL